MAWPQATRNIFSRLVWRVGYTTSCYGETKEEKKGFSESSAGQEEEEEAEQRHERNGNFNKKGRGGGRSERSD